MKAHSLSKQDLLKEYNIRKARESLAVFTKAMMPSFQATWYHLKYIEGLEDFANGKINKLSISIGPQHGKSLLSSIMLPAWLLGINPNLRIAVSSDNQSEASRFGKQVSRIMTEPAYLEVFPDTRLSDGNDSYSKNNEEIEVVGYTGG